MGKWEEKSNNEILGEFEIMKQEHIFIKDEIYKLVVKLEKVESDYKDAYNEWLKRLKR